MQKKLVLILVGLVFISGFLYSQTWDYLTRITYTPGGSWNPKIAADSANTIHIVWVEYTPGKPEIYYKNCTYGGTGTWSAPQRLTWSGRDSKDPAIAVDSEDTIHVIWTEWYEPLRSDQCHKASFDGGSTWTSTTRITWSARTNFRPALVTTGTNDLRVFYTDTSPGNLEIYYKRRSFGTWGGLQRLTWTTESSDEVFAGVDGNNDIHIVWVEKLSPDYELFHKKTTDFGATWSVRTRITYSSDLSREPCFDFDPATNVMRLVWNEGWGLEGDIRFKNRDPDTGLFYGLRQLTWVGSCKHPTVTAPSSCEVQVVYANHNGVAFDLYQKSSTSCGGMWSAPFRVTWTPRGSFYPKMISSGPSNYLRLVYQESISGKEEVFFKRGH